MSRKFFPLLVFCLFRQEPFRLMEPGLPYQLLNSRTPEKHQIETMPGGVAVFDFDNDGRLDIFFVNGARQPFLRKTGPEWWNRLYRNLGEGKFEDVTGKAGLRGEGYGMSATAGDYDNDGLTDLLVTGVGFNTLYRNRGDGAFEDVTVKAGIKPSGWSIGGVWFDSDNDGDLDLFIVNYCVWNPLTEPFCGDKIAGYRTYCHPKHCAGLPNVLYRNNGDGTFTDISLESGIGAKIGKGMAAALADYNNDGWKDIFVAAGDVQDNTELYSSRQSKQQNQLFRNRGDGTFESFKFGPARQHRGTAFGDLDGDGAMDAVVTTLDGPVELWRNKFAAGRMWVGFALTGTRSNRDAVGAKVRLSAGGRIQHSHVSPFCGYLGTNARTLYFGLGSTPQAEWAEIVWPSGASQRIQRPASGKVHAITEPPAGAGPGREAAPHPGGPRPVPAP